MLRAPHARLRVLLAVVTLLVLALPARHARASSHLDASVSHGHSHNSCKGKRDFGLGALEMFATTFKPSGLAVNGDDTPRRLVGLAAPASNQLLLGGGLALEFRCDFMIIDVLSLRLASSLAPAGYGSPMADGNPVDVSLGAFHLAEIGLPFLGAPSGFQVFPEKGWKVAFRLDWGVAHAWTSASVSGAFGTAAASIDDWDLFFRAQLGVCRRVGEVGFSTSWACLTAAPVVYEKGWFPGASIGLRVEL